MLQCPLPFLRNAFIIFGYKDKAIPVTGRGGPLGCETLRLPHFLDNRLTDGGKVDSPTWYSFLLEAESTTVMRLEILGKRRNPMTPWIEPAAIRFSIVPQQTTLPHAAYLDITSLKN
jgi:hypothetical protein